MLSYRQLLILLNSAIHLMRRVEQYISISINSVARNTTGGRPLLMVSVRLTRSDIQPSMLTLVLLGKLMRFKTVVMLSNMIEAF